MLIHAGVVVPNNAGDPTSSPGVPHSNTDFRKLSSLGRCTSLKARCRCPGSMWDGGGAVKL